MLDLHPYLIVPIGLDITIARTFLIGYLKMYGGTLLLEVFLLEEETQQW